MRYFTVLFFILFTTLLSAQTHIVKGTVVNEITNYVEPDVNIINLNSLKISKTNSKGNFEIEAKLNDSIHFSAEGYRSLKLKVTNDWLKNPSITVYIKDNSTTLDELFISNLKLTGFLQVDTKLIEMNDYYYYRSFKPTSFASNFLTKLDPVDAIYNSIKKNSATNKKIEQLKQETELIELMKTKYDRETVSALLNISKEDIVKVLQSCNHTDRFIYTASDYQVFNALNECLEVHNISRK
nr:hypothetical protein [uncultured Flavobacterium sp.]